MHTQDALIHTGMVAIEFEHQLARVAPDDLMRVGLALMGPATYDVRVAPGPGGFGESYERPLRAEDVAFALIRDTDIPRRLAGVLRRSVPNLLDSYAESDDAHWASMAMSWDNKWEINSHWHPEPTNKGPKLAFEAIGPVVHDRLATIAATLAGQSRPHKYTGEIADMVDAALAELLAN